MVSLTFEIRTKTISSATPLFLREARISSLFYLTLFFAEPPTARLKKVQEE